MPWLANPLLDFKPVRALMETAVGISAKRSLPHYARERFDTWFSKRAVAGGGDPGRQQGFATRAGAAVNASGYSRGHVILWDDTFVRYHEPHIGIAAVKVLEALGLEVSLVNNRHCCGRPAFSVGNLDAAAKLGQHNVSQLSTLPPSPGYGAASNSQLTGVPILFLEPSCWSMFVEDYRELKIQNAESVASRCFLFEKFVDDLLAREADALQFKNGSMNIAIHPHCHAKSILNPGFMKRLAERLPGRRATVLDTACCGMAGSFGARAEKYEVSVQVAERLVNNIDAQPPGTQIVASGTSCRHQIADLSNAHPKHMAELLAEALY
jgi:Fe-S oxidoreductase